MEIDSLAHVSPRAKIGSHVSVGPYTIVHDNVEIGDGTRIESHCVIGSPTPRAQGRPLRIVGDALIRSFSVLTSNLEWILG